MLAHNSTTNASFHTTNKLSNQPTNLSMNQSTNQLINLSINQTQKEIVVQRAIFYNILFLRHDINIHSIPRVVINAPVGNKTQQHHNKFPLNYILQHCNSLH